MPLTRPRIVLIVAAADNDVIGRNNALPWHLPADLKRFKALTLGKPIIMGRKTFESIGKPLPGRTNVVLSRSHGIAPSGVTVVSDWPTALRAAGDVPEVCVIGGAALYAVALPLAQEIQLTRVHAAPEGDAFLPPDFAKGFREVACEYHPADERHAHAMSFITMTRGPAVTATR